MSENHLFADIPLKALIEKEGKILFVLGADDDNWQLPGGRVNEGEELEEAFKREILEELGLDVEPKSIFDAFLFKSASGKNHVVIIYKCEVLNGLGNIKFNDGEIKEIKWVGVKDFEEIKMRNGYRKVLRKFFPSA